MNIYAIPGLGADGRVFKNLHPKHPIKIIEWKPAEVDESIEHYAERMAADIDNSEPFILLGLSFGGVMAQEVVQYVKPEKLILLSSIAHQDELQELFKLVHKSGILNLWPHSFYKPPIPLCKWYFGTDDTELVKAILHDTNTELTKWSVLRLMSWEKKAHAIPTIRIHGTSDRLLRYHESAFPIEGGTHFMVVDRAKEIADWIDTNT